MGRVTPRVRTELGIKLWTTATIYVANEVMQVLTTILDHRRLNLSALLSRKETLSDGLFTWITTRHLKTAVLEIYHPNNFNMALERWDLIFKYEEPKGFSDCETETARQFRTYFDEIRGLMGRLEALPGGSEYRLVLDLDANAPLVNGWQQTELKDIGHLERWHRGERDVIEIGLINVGMEYRGRAYRGWNISKIPGRYENRIFIGGNYHFMPNLREIEGYVREKGFQPILAYDFNMPESEINKCSLFLLHKCKYAISDVTYPAEGALMELQMAKCYGTTVLIVYQLHSKPSSMVTTLGYPIRGYSSFDELRRITAQWFTGIKGGSV